MRLFGILFCALFLSACSPMDQLSTPEVVHPQLLVQQPLPSVPASFNNKDFMLDMNIYIAEDGSVKKVHFLKGSGDTEWDAKAISVIHQWKYSPARMNNTAVRLWLHQKAKVQYAEPIYISVETILCSSPEEAESLYTSLSGTSTPEASDNTSTDNVTDTKTITTERVNIYSYPNHIQQVLLSLDKNLFSKPVKYGEHYAIFKRM